MITRRDFCKGAVGLSALGLALPTVFERAVLAAGLEHGSGADTPDRTLVVVQLAGGNDGLNTLVPYGDPAYARLRPRLGVKADDLLKIDDRFGLHPRLAPLKAFWEGGSLAIVQGVGYPEPNLSHFRSMAIWETADPTGPPGEGWVGKYFNGLGDSAKKDPFIGFAPGNSVPPELRSNKVNATVVSSVETYQLRDSTRSGASGRNEAVLKLYGSSPSGGRYADLLHATAEAAFESSRALQRAHAAYRPAVAYPNSPLANQLKLVAEVISQDLGVRVAHVLLGGFDTHSRQVPTQERLLAELAESLSAFQQDLQAMGKDQRVLTFTWTEFGRRAQENASEGTDHGTAGLMFLLGAGVKGGLYGEPPSLTDLDNGNLKFTTDFRSVYATVLEGWLNAPADRVLGGRFPTLPVLAA